MMNTLKRVHYYEAETNTQVLLEVVFPIITGIPESFCCASVPLSVDGVGLYTAWVCGSMQYWREIFVI